MLKSTKTTPIFRIIVNADDLGISPGVNNAVRQGYEEGFITSSTLMVTTEYAEHAKREAIQPTDMPTGLHLSLTSGRCCAPPEQVPLLVDKQGAFKHSAAQLFIKLLFSPNKHQELIKQIALELRAQMARLSDMGVSPTHFDSHQHVHAIPVILETLNTIAPKFGYTKCRLSNDELMKGLPLSKWQHAIQRKNISKWLALTLSNRLAQGIFITPNVFCGLLSSGCMSKKTLRHFFNQTRTGDTVEVGVHVGTCTDDKQCTIINEKDYNFTTCLERRNELSLVCNLDIMRSALEQGAEFISYREL